MKAIFFFQSLLIHIIFDQIQFIFSFFPCKIYLIVIHYSLTYFCQSSSFFINFGLMNSKNFLIDIFKCICSYFLAKICNCIKIHSIAFYRFFFCQKPLIMIYIFYFNRFYAPVSEKHELFPVVVHCIIVYLIFSITNNLWLVSQ